MFGKKKTDITPQEGKHKSIDRKIFAFTMFTIGNIFALSAASFAWFYTATHNSEISTVSGDMNVNIKKITAHKYVYPFYNNSTEFVDYGVSGTIKSYVIEDTSIDAVDNPATTTTIPLTGTTAGTVSASAGTSSVIHYSKSHNENLLYFLVGDAYFNGVSTDPWSNLTGAAFNSTSAISTESSAIASNVVVSKGAMFKLFDSTSVDGSNCTYFTYGEPSGNSSKTPCFSIENGSIKCLKSGIYTFTYRVEVVEEVETKYLDIALSRSDNAIIDNNVLDPTMVTLDYYASPIATRGTFDEFLSAHFPAKIQEQNTMVILDVELTYKNENPIEAGLKIFRNADPSGSIYNLAGKYANTGSYIHGVESNTPDPELRSSDFYSFYGLFCDEANQFANVQSLWNAMHLETRSKVEDEVVKGVDFVRFQNDTTFDTEVSCPLALQGSTPSTTIPGSTSESTYHCYVAIEYDYDHCKFFTNEDRLGKRYILGRDFYFYFTGTQVTEG